MLGIYLSYALKQQRNEAPHSLFNRNFVRILSNIYIYIETVISYLLNNATTVGLRTLIEKLYFRADVISYYLFVPGSTLIFWLRFRCVKILGPMFHYSPFPTPCSAATHWGRTIGPGHRALGQHIRCVPKSVLLVPKIEPYTRLSFHKQICT